MQKKETPTLQICIAVLGLIISGGLIDIAHSLVATRDGVLALSQLVPELKAEIRYVKKSLEDYKMSVDSQILVFQNEIGNLQNKVGDVKKKNNTYE